jgi:hypothetical protein
MTREPTWGRHGIARAETRKAGACIACMVFVAAMGAAFWIGTLWASQIWIAAGR